MLELKDVLGRALTIFCQLSKLRRPEHVSDEDCLVAISDKCVEVLACSLEAILKKHLLIRTVNHGIHHQYLTIVNVLSFVREFRFLRLVFCFGSLLCRLLGLNLLAKIIEVDLNLLVSLFFHNLLFVGRHSFMLQYFHDSWALGFTQ